MHATALRQVFLPMLCLLLGSVLPLAGSTVPHFPASDSLPSAPAPSRVSVPSVTDLRPAVIHPGHVTIPRLQSEPRLGDFLTGTARSRRAPHTKKPQNKCCASATSSTVIRKTDGL